MKIQGISTGKAARLCSVKPDTVLKWIKKGRLAATRTAGGHYRIEERALAALMPALEASQIRPTPVSEKCSRPLRCWEYLSRSGTLRNECRKCVVYRIRASWCFEMATLGCGLDELKGAHNVSCEGCAYFRRVSGQATAVLVITADSEFAGFLQRGKREAVELRFARTAYDASAMVGSFRPAFAVVDADLPGSGDPDLLACLAADPRLPGLKIILAAPANSKIRAEELQEKGVVSVIEKPFGQDRIEEVVNRFPVERI